jgi:hypothetical protein
MLCFRKVFGLEVDDILHAKLDGCTLCVLPIKDNNNYDLVILSEKDKINFRRHLADRGDEENLKQLGKYADADADVCFQLCVRTVDENGAGGAHLSVACQMVEQLQDKPVVFVCISCYLQTETIKYDGMVPSHALFQEKYLDKSSARYRFPLQNLKPVWL